MSPEERIQTLERELIRAKRRDRWLVAGICLAVLVAIMGWISTHTLITAQTQNMGTVQKEVRAQEFLVTDATGKVRGSLGYDSDGGSKLALVGDGMATLNSDGLYIQRWKGGSFSVFMDDGGGSMLSMSNVNSRIDLMLDSASSVSMDANGKKVFDEQSGAWLSMRHANVEQRIWLGVQKDRTWLELSDAKGKGRAVLGSVSTVTPGGKTINYPESSLTLFGADGKVIWSALP